MALQQIAQKLRGLRERTWMLVAEALSDIETAFYGTYTDMGWFKVSEKASGIRQAVLETAMLRVTSGRNNVPLAILRSLDGEFVVLLPKDASTGIVDLANENATEVNLLDLLMFSYQAEYQLTADVTIEAPVVARPNRRLLIFIFQHASTLYVPSFDSNDFVDSEDQHIDLSMGWVREYVGRSDGKWYPVSNAIQFDPTA